MGKKSPDALWHLVFWGWHLFRMHNMVGGLWDLKGPLASHSRRVSLDTLAPSAPCFGSFAAKKRYLIVFSWSPTPSSVGRGGTKHTVAKKNTDQMVCVLFGCGDGIWKCGEEPLVRTQQWVICYSSVGHDELRNVWPRLLWRLELYVLLCVSFSMLRRLWFFFATKPVQRAKGPEVQTPSRNARSE